MHGRSHRRLQCVFTPRRCRYIQTRGDRSAASHGLHLHISMSSSQALACRRARYCPSCSRRLPSDVRSAPERARPRALRNAAARDIIDLRQMSRSVRRQQERRRRANGGHVSRATAERAAVLGISKGPSERQRDRSRGRSARQRQGGDWPMFRLRAEIFTDTAYSFTGRMHAEV